MPQKQLEGTCPLLATASCQGATLLLSVRHAPIDFPSLQGPNTYARMWQEEAVVIRQER